MLSNAIFGQFVGKDDVSKALFYLQKTELDSAKKYIDFAVNDLEAKELPKTLYYRGYIYKELYKSKQKKNNASPYRLIAIKSLKKLLSTNGADEFTKSSTKILEYLASTLYNDAARSLTPTNYKEAEGNYNLFRQTILSAYPSKDVTPLDIKFKLALASIFNKQSEDGEPVDAELIGRAKKIYVEVILLDENNGSANYNLATLYYNEAVNIINNMDYDMDLMKLNDTQDSCVKLFLKALPYMKKSHDLAYRCKETLIGLSNIYYGLNDMEKSDYYKKTLKALEEIDEKIEKIAKEGVESSGGNEQLENLKKERERLCEERED